MSLILRAMSFTIALEMVLRRFTAFLPSFIRVGWFMKRTFSFKSFTSRVSLGQTLSSSLASFLFPIQTNLHPIYCPLFLQKSSHRALRFSAGPLGRTRIFHSLYLIRKQMVKEWIHPLLNILQKILVGNRFKMKINTWNHFEKRAKRSFLPVVL